MLWQGAGAGGVALPQRRRRRIRANGYFIRWRHDVRLATVRLCYGVERAIVCVCSTSFQRTDYLFWANHSQPFGEQQIATMGIKNLLGNGREAEIDELGRRCRDRPLSGRSDHSEEDPERGCRIVDTVWRRHECLEARSPNAIEQVTSIIHGKASMKKRGDASRALGPDAGII
jgi:hypothetical protein